MEKRYLEKYLYIGICIFVLLFMIFKIKWMDAIGYSVTISLFIYYVYTKYLWEFNPIESMPKLKNEYEATIEYSLNGNKCCKAVKVYIKQDLNNIFITMMTDESFSKSISSNIYKEQNVWYLTYTYINRPDQKVSYRSRTHYGTCTLNLNDLNNIKGQYYSDRKSAGDITFK